MDSLTHALVAAMLFLNPFPGQPVFFAILGATLPDIDFIFRRISDHDPGLFIFSHGGFTHSIPGILAVSAGIAAGFLSWQSWVGQVWDLSPLLTVFVFSCAGGLTHLLLDVLAFPGIPLLYPVTSRKITAGIFPGPSLVFLAISLALLLLFMFGFPVFTLFPSIAVFGGMYILAHVLLKVFVSRKHRGITIPTFNPLRWLIIRKSGDSYEVYRTGLRNRPGHVKVYPRNDGVDPEYICRHSDDPEVQRLAYYSYIMVTGTEGGGVVIRDPLREDGFLFYPPSYTRVLIKER